MTDLRVGLNKGHPTTPIEKQVKPSHRKGVSSTRTKFVRSIIREVAGFTPYERRVMELLRNSKVRLQRFSSIVKDGYTDMRSARLQDKKARKLTKKRVRKRCRYDLEISPSHYSLSFSSSVRFCARSASWRSLAPLSRSTGEQVTKSSALPASLHSLSTSWLYGLYLYVAPMHFLFTMQMQDEKTYRSDYSACGREYLAVVVCALDPQLNRPVEPERLLLYSIDTTISSIRSILFELLHIVPEVG